MRLFNPSLIIIALFLFGGFVFKSMTPDTCTSILPFDNLFVLTGDTKRIPFAMKKFRKNPNTKLYIIGDGAPSSLAKKDKIIIDSNSKNTYQNALSIKSFVQKESLDRIVLITSNYHIGRARLLIKKELPDIEVALCPISIDDMDIKKQIEYWLIEYVKYVGTLLGIKES